MRQDEYHPAHCFLDVVDDRCPVADAPGRGIGGGAGSATSAESSAVLFHCRNPEDASSGVATYSARIGSLTEVGGQRLDLMFDAMDEAGLCGGGSPVHTPIQPRRRDDPEGFLRPDRPLCDYSRAAAWLWPIR